MNFLEQIEKELYNSGAMDIYKLIRQKVSELKKIIGFKCKSCGSCCTPSVGLSEEDFFFMKEMNINLEGIKMYQLSNGSLIPQEDLKYKIRKDGKDWGTRGIYFYEEERSQKTFCRIHPNNSLVCHSFPFVVNLSKKSFFIKMSCTWMEDNLQGFAVEVKYADEIKALIEDFHEALENYDE